MMDIAKLQFQLTLLKDKAKVTPTDQLTECLQVLWELRDIVRQELDSRELENKQ